MAQDGRISIPRVTSLIGGKPTRLSPGVYRSASGGLVGSNGKPLPQRQARSGESLVDAVRGARPKQLFGGNVLNDQQRRERGIDPRDPNQYWEGPDGNVFGTLMGWPGMGSSKPLPPPKPSSNDGSVSGLLRRARPEPSFDDDSILELIRRFSR